MLRTIGFALLFVACVSPTLAQAPRFVERPTAGMTVNGLGRGVAVADYDRDGDDDVFAAIEYSASKLFRNDGTGRFTDVTAAANLSTGLSRGLTYMAPLWVDFDNDGFPDLFVGGYQSPHVLFRNRGDGTFEDVSAAAGLDMGADLRSVAAADFDGDGWVDLFFPSDRAPDRLYRNRGAGSPFAFEDVTSQSGVQGENFSVAMQVSWNDYDHDGDQDLFAVLDGEGRLGNGTVNPLVANRLHRNPGYLPLLDQAHVVGFRDPGAGNSMGIAWGDYDGDGWEDAYVSRKDEGGLYRNRGDGTFEIVPDAAGAERNGMAWGTVFGDFDNDGDPDLFVANAYGYYRMKSLLYENRGAAFVEVGEAAGAAFEHEMTGVASGDFNGDGLLDLVFSAYDGKVHLLEGAPVSPGRWLKVDLTGVRSNRMAIGARVTVRAGSRTWVQAIRAGDSFASQNSPTLHFGLGAAQRVDEVRVHWGANREDVVRDVPAGTRLSIVESGSSTSAEPGQRPAIATLEGPFPHPVTGLARFRLAGAARSIGSAEVIDLLARVVARPQPIPGGIDVETGDLAPGLYVLRVEIDGNPVLRTFLVAR